MHKILFNFLIVGVSLAGIQGASAMEDDNQSSRTPRKLQDTPEIQNIQRIPCAPMKASARHFGRTRVEKSPNEYEMIGGTLWKKVQSETPSMVAYK
ncbi:MAG: hypothetical protein H0X26_06080 [Alphaproteobacteria bacterium]|nr:hypothetical protein [Alphaproteobacteria bacterium]